MRTHVHMPTHVLTGMFAQELDLQVGWGSRKLGDSVLAWGGQDAVWVPPRSSAPPPPRDFICPSSIFMATRSGSPRAVGLKSLKVSRKVAGLTPLDPYRDLPQRSGPLNGGMGSIQVCWGLQAPSLAAWGMQERKEGEEDRGLEGGGHAYGCFPPATSWMRRPTRPSAREAPRQRVQVDG